jgi:cell volume regulation protein A
MFAVALTRPKPSYSEGDRAMGSPDSGLVILLGSLLVLAGILSVDRDALRAAALVFLLVGMLAGENGPGGIKFDDVGVAYTVGSIALALILFDGGLRTRFVTSAMFWRRR